MNVPTHRRVVLTAAAAAIAVGSAGTALAADIEMRLGTNAAPLAIETKASKEFARLVNERSDGAINIEVFEGEKLGGPVAQIENLQLGTQDLHANVSDWLQQLDKDWATLAMPFLFSGVDHVKQFQETPTYEAMKQRLIDEHGLRIVADNWYRLPKVLVTTSPVFEPDDLDGMKLRMPDLATYVQTWAAFGARPTPLAWNEAYLAMKTGTVEGMDSPLNLVYPQKFYQAAPYILMTDHLVAPYVVLISEKTWQDLDEGQRELLTEAGRDAGDFYTQQVIDTFAEHKQAMLAEGAAFIEVDTSPFAAKARDVMEAFESEGAWSAGMVDEIRGLSS